GCARGVEHPRLKRGATAVRLEIFVRQAVQEFDLLSEAEERPRQPSRPGTEGRVALLAARAAIRSVGDVEEALVSDAAAHVVTIASPAVIDRKLRRRARM